MEKNKIIEELYQAIETFGLMPTIGKVFGVGTRIQIPFSESACNTKLEDLDWSVRSYNCLKRAGYKNTLPFCFFIGSFLSGISAVTSPSPAGIPC